MNPRKRPRYPDERFERCRECGERWNVSIGAKMPPNGYLCPVCRSKYGERKKEKKNG